MGSVPTVLPLTLLRINWLRREELHFRPSGYGPAALLLRRKNCNKYTTYLLQNLIGSERVLQHESPRHNFGDLERGDIT